MTSIKTIWESHIPNHEIIIKTQLESVKSFKCYAATNHITGSHSFIFEASNKIVFPEFKNFKFQGLFIEIFEFDEIKELHIYLLDNQLKDIFSLFIDNIIEDIISSVTENEALISISNVVVKWKKLFDKINFQGLTVEQQKGLIGELLLINSIMEDGLDIDYLLECWTGPDYDDKDFIFGTIGIEVKLTSSKLPRLKISSERQLDSENLEVLYLILYIVEEVKDKGFSLNSLIEKIRLKINNNQNALKYFNERLLLLGYNDDDTDNYNSKYALRKSNFYKVAKDFPRLVTADLPLGLFDAKYSIELSSIESYLKKNDSILQLIKQ